MKKYAIDLKIESQNTAGTKPRMDCSAILKDLGYNLKFVNYRIPRNCFDKIKVYKNIFKEHKKIIDKVPNNSIICLQYSWYGIFWLYIRYFKKMKKKKNLKFIAIIHDLDVLRKSNKKLELWFKYIVKENKFLNCFDFIICHNDKMKNYLISNGINNDKLVSLGIFDYLVNTSINDNLPKDYKKVIFAGNLKESKSGFIYKLGEVKSKKYNYELYGPNYTGQNNKFLKYNGIFKPEELLEHLSSGFGLVWDGDSYDLCDGSMGEYLKYNNPHKLSLYMACGIPIIVWSESALASFVEKNKIGIIVSSLKEVEGIISKIRIEEYNELLKNVKKIQKKVIKGYYLKEAIKKVENKIK